MSKDMDKKFSRLTILYVMKCAINYVLFLLLICMPIIGANATDQTQIPIDSVKMLKNYPLEFGNTAFTIYINARDDYEDVSLAEIDRYAKQSHGNGYLYLALDEMFNDGSEAVVWRQIGKARSHGSLDAMVLSGYAYEYGFGGYKQNIDVAAKLFRKAASPLLKRTSGNEKKATQTPNHGNVFQLANFLRRHPKKQISDNEADMIEEEAQRQFITAMNMKANRKKSPEPPSSDAEADKIAQHYLTSTEPNIAEMQLELANYFMDGPVLNQFSNSKSNAFKLRESVYREFNDDYSKHESLNLVLAHHYGEGIGTQRDLKRAAMHLHVPAKQGDVDAIIDLASYSIRGGDSLGKYKQNGDEIIVALRPLMFEGEKITSKQRIAIAVFLSFVYDNGMDVEKNFVTAYSWYRLAYEIEPAADESRATRLEQFHNKMNAEQKVYYEQAYQALRQELGMERID